METELFVHFAEIAGIFVGFGALISQRSGRPRDPHDVVYLRGVLIEGVWVVIVALVPVTISRYGVREDAVWLPSAVFALVLWAVFVVVFNRQADVRSLNWSPETMDRFFPLVGLPLHVAIAGSLVLIVVGAWSGLAEALYVTALAAGVVFASYTLLALVMSQNHGPAPGGEPA